MAGEDVTEAALKRAWEAPKPAWVTGEVVLEQVAGIAVLSAADLRSVPLAPRSERRLGRWEEFFRAWRALSPEDQRQLRTAGQVARPMDSEVGTTDQVPPTVERGKERDRGPHPSRTRHSASHIPKDETVLTISLGRRPRVTTPRQATWLDDPHLGRALLGFVRSDYQPPVCPTLPGEVKLTEWFSDTLESFAKLVRQKGTPDLVVDRRCRERRVLISPGAYRAEALCDAAAAACGAELRRVSDVWLLAALCPEDLAWRRAAAILPEQPDAGMLPAAAREWTCSLKALPTELREWVLEAAQVYSHVDEPGDTSGTLHLRSVLTVSREERTTPNGHGRGTPVQSGGGWAEQLY